MRADAREQWTQDTREEIELIEIERLPGNHGILMKTRLSFFTTLIKRLIDLLELTTRGVFDYLRPCFIGFPEGDRVNVSRSAISPQRFVGNFSNVWPAHYDAHTRKADCIGDAIGFFGHSGHRADTDQIDFLFLYEPDDLFITHRPRIGINEQNFMTGRRDGLQQKHPEMRHEVARDAIVRVIEQDFHSSDLRSQKRDFSSSLNCAKG